MTQFTVARILQDNDHPTRRLCAEIDGALWPLTNDPKGQTVNIGGHLVGLVSYEPEGQHATFIPCGDIVDLTTNTQPDLTLEEARGMAYRPIFNVIRQALTTYDRSQENKRGFNRYALAQYLERADNVEKRVTLQDEGLVAALRAEFIPGVQPLRSVATHLQKKGFISAPEVAALNAK